MREWTIEIADRNARLIADGPWPQYDEGKVEVVEKTALASEKAKVGHLREVLQVMVKYYDRNDCWSGCHCPVCLAKHALSTTS